MNATILLVDSDLIDRADWQALLQFHGYKVIAASSGKAALDSFPSVRPDLVLIDSSLQDIPSDEICRRIKADPRAGDTPIVIVGSYHSRIKVWNAQPDQAGMSPTNPATRTQALDRIHALLAGGQFHLFAESPEKAQDCPECNKRLSSTPSMQIGG